MLYSFDGYHDKNKVLYENSYGTENGGGDNKSDSKIEMLCIAQNVAIQNEI